MKRIIKAMEEKYLVPSLELVEQVFTAHSDPEEGSLVRSLVEEIRSKRFYVPELELIMVDGDTDEVIGYVKERHGHWIYTERGFPLAYGYNRCSVCGRSIGLDSTDYCPNCGAKMDEVITDE